MTRVRWTKHCLSCKVMSNSLMCDTHPALCFLSPQEDKTVFTRALRHGREHAPRRAGISKCRRSERNRAQRLEGYSVQQKAVALGSCLPGRVNPSSRWPSSCSAVSRRPQCYLARGRSLLPLYLCSMFLLFCSFFFFSRGLHATPRATEETPVLFNLLLSSDIEVYKTGM